jgi:hypothetical protein
MTTCDPRQLRGTLGPQRTFHERTGEIRSQREDHRAARLGPQRPQRFEEPLALLGARLREQFLELIDDDQRRGSGRAMGEQCGDPCRHRERLSRWCVERLAESRERLLAGPELSDDKRAEPGEPAREPRQDSRRHQR